ncbi:hypothetical protein ABTX99_06805, partial [Streptomyces flaveolus]
MAAKPVAQRAKRLVVLVSGSGTNLQALLDEIDRVEGLAAVEELDVGHRHVVDRGDVVDVPPV